MPAAKIAITIDEELKPYEAAEIEAQIQEQREKKYGKKGFKKGHSKENDPRLKEEGVARDAKGAKPPRV